MTYGEPCGGGCLDVIVMTITDCLFPAIIIAVAIIAIILAILPGG